ncbi:hypothetical protein [Georgenia muralis]|uniref:MYXO-CTERM domain-containing protein n=1 Tax=Georgenia muralis TaxID=154117 RepID=A0A3N4ZLQ3_9MICO|nr:hypothetical protein [Georgenia muralis]RPF26708.1 hypothetical protein EDD32_1157 [Georgenia muralis]
MTLRPAALTAVAVLALAAPATAAAATLPVPASPAPAAPVVAASVATGDACTGPDGVTVVVDLTDLGGAVEVGCADGDPATGREALESAGFAPTDSSPGFICAVEGLPDPCPEEFDGSYWSYWTAEPAGDWVAQTEGADTTDPVPGTFEGWRYNDGSTGPGVAPAALAGTAASDAATEDASASAPDSADASGEAATDEVAGDGPDADGGFPVGAALAVGALVALVAVVLVRRRS